MITYLSPQVWQACSSHLQARRDSWWSLHKKTNNNGILTLIKGGITVSTHIDKYLCHILLAKVWNPYGYKWCNFNKIFLNAVKESFPSHSKLWLNYWFVPSVKKNCIFYLLWHSLVILFLFLFPPPDLLWQKISRNPIIKKCWPKMRPYLYKSSSYLFSENMWSCLPIPFENYSESKKKLYCIQNCAKLGRVVTREQCITKLML